MSRCASSLLVKERLLPDDVRARWDHVRDFPEYIEPWLQRCRRWAIASLGPWDYLLLLLNSSLLQPNNPVERYPLLGEVIGEIRQNPGLLATTHPTRGLDGPTVRRHLTAFEEAGSTARMRERLGTCFTVEPLPQMPVTGSLYVIDGMHRLVAYGIASELRPGFFPIDIVVGTTDREP